MSSRSLFLSQAPCASCARHCLISSLRKTESANASFSIISASAIDRLVLQIEIPLFAFHHRLAQPWRRVALQNCNQLVEKHGDLLGLVDFDGMNAGGDHACSARASDSRDIQDRHVLDCLDLRKELVLVAVLFEIAFELEDLHKAVALRRDLVNRDIFGPTEMRIHAL